MKVKEPYYHIYNTPISRVVRDESYDSLWAYTYAPPKIRLSTDNDGVMSNNTFMFKIFQYILKESLSETYEPFDFKNFLSVYCATFNINFLKILQNIYV